MKRRYCRLGSQEKKGKVNKVNKDHYPFDGLGFVNLLYHKLINVPKVKEIIQYLGKLNQRPRGPNSTARSPCTTEVSLEFCNLQYTSYCLIFLVNVERDGSGVRQR